MTDRFQLVAPYEPAGDQPQAIEQAGRGLRGRPGAPDAARRDRLGQDLHDRQRHPEGAEARRWCWRRTRRWPRSSTASSRSSSRTTRSSISSATTTTTSPRPTCRRRDTYIEKDASINEHIEQMRLSATKALLSSGATRSSSRTVSAIYGLGDPDDVPQDGAAPDARRAHRPARADPPPDRACSTRATSCDLRRGTLSRARRGHRRVPGRIASARRCASSCSTATSSRWRSSIR